MNLVLTAVIAAAITILIFIGMWIGWKSRARRGEGIHVNPLPPSGEIIDEFPRAGYVSTTPAGEPLVRLAVPGLVYKGNADVTVRQDGITIQVTGEDAVHLTAQQVSGHQPARVRVGKAVERDGLEILNWTSGDDHVESSFRFQTSDEQHRFARAIDTLTQTSSDHGSGSITTTDTPQEDA